jgi:glycosyltransferase involved in cell wall biosynthesis
MNILHISTFLQGGAGKVIVDLSVKEKRRGNNIRVVCTPKSVGDYSNYPDYIEKLTEEKIPVHYLESTFNRNLKNITSAADQLIQIIQEFEIDIIHSHAGTPSLIAMISVSKAGRKMAVIQTMHGWGIFKSKSQEIQDISILNIVDQVVSVSKSSAKLLIQKGLKNNNHTTIYNGVIPEHNPLSNQNESDKKAIERLRKKNVFIAGCVGTIDERKNQKLIIHALSKLPTSLSYRFYFVGEGILAEELKVLCGEYGISDKVHFLGYKPTGREYIALLDLLVCPSRSEGAPPLALMEAFAEKVPVLASNTPEHSEAINHMQSGLLFDKDSIGSFALLLEACINETKKDLLSSNAYKFYQKYFSFDQNAEKYKDIYQSLYQR